MSLDAYWFVVGGLLVAGELLAHFFMRNKRFHTISWLTKAAEHATGLPGHIVFGAFWLLLGAHLEGWLW